MEPFEFDNEDSYTQFRAFSSIGILFRTVTVIGSVNITKRKNRETFGWGLLAFFPPSIALIIVGQLKKLIDPNERKTAIANGLKNIVYKKTKPSMKIESKDSFLADDYPQFIEEINEIRERIQGISKVNVAEILIAYCRNHSIQSGLEVTNPIFTKMIVTEQIPIEYKEQIFLRNEIYEIFIKKFESYLRAAWS